jgi:hypothetical protein
MNGLAASVAGPSSLRILTADSAQVIGAGLA